MLRQELIELKRHPEQNQQAHHGATKIISFPPTHFHSFIHSRSCSFFVLLTCVKSKKTLIGLVLFCWDVHSPSAQRRLYVWLVRPSWDALCCFRSRCAVWAARAGRWGRMLWYFSSAGTINTVWSRLQYLPSAGGDVCFGPQRRCDLVQTGRSWVNHPEKARVASRETWSRPMTGPVFVQRGSGSDYSGRKWCFTTWLF